MHCMDCGNELETINYVESCTKYHCSECNVYWYQSRTVVVEWSKIGVPLESDNGGINAPTMSTNQQDLLEELQKVIRKIDNTCGDWEWHYCKEGTPQRYVSDLLAQYRWSSKWTGSE